MSRRRGVGVIALAVLGLGCHGRAEPTESESPSVASPPASAAASEPPPPDHLAPGELLEGTQVAFGVKLPRDLQLEEAFDNVAYARGSASVHSLVGYFRARLRDGSLHEGETSATFDHVHAPSRPERELSVHMTTTMGGVRVEMRDTTPPRQSNLPNDEARFRAVGLGPDGRWIDPTHLN